MSSVAEVLDSCTAADDFLEGLDEMLAIKDTIPEHITEAKIYQLAAEVARDIQSYESVLRGFDIDEDEYEIIKRTSLYASAYTEAKAAFASDPSARITAKTDAAVEHFLLPKVVLALQDPDIPMAAITQLGKLLIELGSAKAKAALPEAQAPGTNLKLLINVDLGNGDTRQIGISHQDEKVISDSDLD